MVNILLTTVRNISAYENVPVPTPKGFSDIRKWHYNEMKKCLLMSQGGHLIKKRFCITEISLSGRDIRKRSNIKNYTPSESMYFLANNYTEKTNALHSHGADTL